MRDQIVVKLRQRLTRLEGEARERLEQALGPLDALPDRSAAQLLAFRDDKRQNSAQMTGVVAKMNDAEIRAVSDYIAGIR